MSICLCGYPECSLRITMVNCWAESSGSQIIRIDGAQSVRIEGCTFFFERTSHNLLWWQKYLTHAVYVTNIPMGRLNELLAEMWADAQIREREALNVENDLEAPER